MAGDRAWRPLVLSLLLLTPISACYLGETTKSDVESAYLKQVKIVGHELVDNYYEKGTTGIYVGEPSANLIPLISGPRLEVERPQASYSDTVFDHVADGRGSTSDGTECLFGFFRLRDGKVPFSSWNLSDKDIQNVSSGRAEVIMVELGCAPFD